MILSEIGVTFLMTDALFVLVKKQLISVSSIACAQNTYGRVYSQGLFLCVVMFCLFTFSKESLLLYIKFNYYAR